MTKLFWCVCFLLIAFRDIWGKVTQVEINKPRPSDDYLAAQSYTPKSFVKWFDLWFCTYIAFREFVLWRTSNQSIRARNMFQSTAMKFRTVTPVNCCIHTEMSGNDLLDLMTSCCNLIPACKQFTIPSQTVLGDNCSGQRRRNGEIDETVQRVSRCNGSAAPFWGQSNFLCAS